MAFEIAKFEDAEIRIDSFDGHKWVVVRDLAKALGYVDHRPLFTLLDRNPDEFKGKQRVIKLMTTSGWKDTRVINYHGVIRVAMKSDAPKAVKFRDWAEEVLFQVMTTGSYSMKPISRNPQWQESLSASERLKLAEMRMSCWMKLADRPKSRYLWNALYSTFGGQAGYAEYLRQVNDGTAPQTQEEWEEFWNEDPESGPGDEWFGKKVN